MGTQNTAHCQESPTGAMMRHIGRACQRVRLAAAVPHRLAMLGARPQCPEDSGRAAAWWNKTIQQAPGFIKTCKIELVSVDEDGVVLQMPVDRDHMQVMGVVHGGAITTLADTAAGFGCMLKTNGKGITTIELKTNFVGSAKEGDLLIARAWCQHAGKTTQVPRPMTVWCSAYAATMM